ncbi:MAG: caspase family protein [Pseudorhodoplanes sp.]|uniref:caspase family protein n=1 Tax=Pseudorhodoplanes sp. TaxID=1934341 RepID=UPI003D11D422
MRVRASIAVAAVSISILVSTNFRASGQTGEVVARVGHSDTVVSAAFSPDSKLVATGGYDRTVKLWEVSTGRLLRTLPHRGSIDALDISPDGRTIVVADEFKTMTVWDLVDGRSLRVIQTGEYIRRMAFSTDPNLLAATCTNEQAPLSSSYSICVWDISAGRKLRLLAGSGEVFEELAYSGNGREIITRTEKSNVFRHWDAASGRELRQSHNLTLNRFRVPGSERLSSPDNSAHLYKVGEKILILSRGVQSDVRGTGKQLRSAAFAPDSQSFATGDDRIRTWDAKTGELRQSFGDRSWPTHLAYAADGKEILSVGLQPLTAWNAETGEVLRRSREDATAMAPDGKTLLFFGSGGSNDLTILDTARNVRRILKGHRKGITAAVISPDGKSAATGSHDRTLRLWDLATGRNLKTIKEADPSRNALERAIREFMAPDLPRSVAFSPDSRVLATGRRDGKVTLHDVATGKLLSSMSGHNSEVYALGFSPSGKLLLSGANDNVVKLWDARTGRPIRTLPEHGGTITKVIFSPDEQRILTAGRDNTARLWTSSGEPLATLVLMESDGWMTITPEGFFTGSLNNPLDVSLVHGLQTYSVEQFYQSLYRPDLVAEKLAGDPRGLVKAAAQKLDLSTVLASGRPPVVSLTSPKEGETITGFQVPAVLNLQPDQGGVGRVEWRVNGVTVAVDENVASAASRTDGPVQLKRQLTLDEGDNRIETVVYNKANLISSLAARVGVKVATGEANVKPRLFVLAVGVNQYAEQPWKLNFAVQDATAIANGLAKAGAGVYDQVDITLLTDDKVTIPGLDAAFRGLSGRVRTSDAFLLYVAGHGVTIDGRYYFVPQDVRVPDRDFSRASLDRIVSSMGVSQDLWQAWLATIPAKRSLLLIDSCESGSLTVEDRNAGALERGVANDRLSQATGRSIITASSSTEEAQEGFHGHGLFTYNVLEALDRADGDGNGKIELNELAAYVHTKVSILSERVYQRRQIPQLRITSSNYPLGSRLRVLAASEPDAGSPAASHFVARDTDLLIQPVMGALSVRKLPAHTMVALINSRAGWSMIAIDGRPLGYLATRDLTKIIN